MDLNKIQLTFKETMKIENIISQIKLSNGSSNINEKIKAYLNIKASQIIKYHNPYLDFNINNYNMYAQNSVLMLDYVPRYVFMIAYTITHLNHPYLIYFNLDDKYINVLFDTVFCELQLVRKVFKGVLHILNISMSLLNALFSIKYESDLE